MSGRAIAGAKAALNTDGQKMIAARVTESYASLFLTSTHDDGSRHAAIARVGAFEVRLLELPSANSPEEASLWVELYDRGHRVGVDSYKCGDLDEAIDVAQLLMTQATRLNYAILIGGITRESIGTSRGLLWPAKTCSTRT